MKPETRVIGFDDGPFRFGDETVPVVGVVMRGSTYVEGVLHTRVDVDGTDATDVLVESVRSSRYWEEVRVILVDGASFGGFNIINLPDLAARTGIPVMSVTRGMPDRDGVRSALETHFADWKARWRILEAQWPKHYATEGTGLGIAAVGLDRAGVAEILARFTVRGIVPEPIRLAHLIAAALVDGESRGRS